MRSYLEFIPFFNSKSEPGKLPQLAIDTPLYQLQLASKKFFTIEENAIAKNGNQLAVKPVATFDLKTYEHSAFINQCIEQFNLSSNHLKNIDAQIAQGLLVSFVASTLSILPFLGGLGWACSWVGLGYAVYKFTERQLAYQEYNESLKLLIGSCNWSLGQMEQAEYQTLPSNHFLNTSLLPKLYSVLTQEQLKCIVSDTIESQFISAQQKDQKKNASYFSAFFGEYVRQNDKATFGKIATQLNYSVYGFNQGAPTDILQVLITSIPDIFRAIGNGFSDVLKKWNAPQQTATATCSP